MKVFLNCSVCKVRNYHFRKSDSERSRRLERKKYCKVCNKHTIHQESK